jgi:hypothetical protein
MNAFSPQAPASPGLPDLMRRIDRKLDIQRGMTLTYDDLALLVTSGAYATLQNANLKFLERQCQEHVERNHYISEGSLLSTRVRGDITRSSGRIPQEDASEALARAQAISRPGGLPSIASTSSRTAAGPPARHVVSRPTAGTSSSHQPSQTT